MVVKQFSETPPGQLEFFCPGDGFELQTPQLLVGLNEEVSAPTRGIEERFVFPKQTPYSVKRSNVRLKLCWMPEICVPMRRWRSCMALSTRQDSQSWLKSTTCLTKL